MGFRRSLARVRNFDGDALLVFIVAMAVVYAYPVFLIVRNGMPDLMGLVALAVWGKLGWWFIRGVFLGGFDDPVSHQSPDRRD